MHEAYITSLVVHTRPAPAEWPLCAPALQSALRLKPTFTDAYNNMASALVQKGLIPAALQCYQTALAVNPNLVRSACPSRMHGCMHAGSPLHATELFWRLPLTLQRCSVLLACSALINVCCCGRLVHGATTPAI